MTIAEDTLMSGVTGLTSSFKFWSWFQFLAYHLFYLSKPSATLAQENVTGVKLYPKHKVIYVFTKQQANDSILNSDWHLLLQVTTRWLEVYVYFDLANANTWSNLLAVTFACLAEIILD